jgi:L-Ala-D/L-Glu epimerase
MKLQELTLRMVRVPLIHPHVLSYRTFTEFEPIIVEARDSDGRVGWGEGHIPPGSSSETREDGWSFCREHAAAVVGKEPTAAKAMIAADLGVRRRRS